MRAPVQLNFLAAGALVAAAYFFWARSFVFALSATAELSVVVAYLFSVNHLVVYLRRSHATTWVSLGRPSFSTLVERSADPLSLAQTGMLTMRFIFGTEHESLEDERLSRAIWLVRVLLVSGVVGLIVVRIVQ